MGFFSSKKPTVTAGSGTGRMGSGRRLQRGLSIPACLETLDNVILCRVMSRTVLTMLPPSSIHIRAGLGALVLPNLLLALRSVHRSLTERLP